MSWPGCHRGVLWPAIWSVERRPGLVQRWLAERWLSPVPHHYTQRTMWRQGHSTRHPQLRHQRQGQEPLWCFLLHLPLQRYFYISKILKTIMKWIPEREIQGPIQLIIEKPTLKKVSGFNPTFSTLIQGWPIVCQTSTLLPEQSVRSLIPNND